MPNMFIEWIILTLCKIRFHLGEVYRKTGRIERAKDCLLYALELEKTQPLEPFSVLPRIV